jgi:hypothetical protein
MINGVQCGDGWPLELQEASAYQYLDTLSEQIADDYKKDAASKENALLDSIGDDSSHDSELIAKLQADLLQARQELRAQQEAKAHEQLLKVSEHLGEQKQQEILRLHEESMKAQDKQMEESSAAQMQELQARIAAKRAARKNVTSQ